MCRISISDYAFMLFIAISSVAVLFWANSVDAITLVDSGRGVATIVVREGLQLSSAEILAVAEFRSYVKKMSGVMLRVATSPNDGGTHVFIGRSPFTGGVLDEKQASAIAPEGFVIKADENALYLVGSTPRATLYAVYEWLEIMGVRWYMPGEMGEEVPELPTIVFGPFERVYRPAFALRSGINGAAFVDPNWDKEVTRWAVRNRLNGNIWDRESYGGGYYSGGSGHSYNYLVPPDKYFLEHPEYYALVNGRRQPTQLETTNPDVVRIAAETIIADCRRFPYDRYSVSPNDGQGFSESSESRKLDVDPNSMTDRVLDFANRVGQIVCREFPNLKIYFYAYDNYIQPPHKVKPEPFIQVELVEWGTSGINKAHPITAPQNRKFRELLDAWLKVTPHITAHTYYGHYNWWVWPVAHQIATNIQYYYEKRIEGLYSETHQHWGTQGINFYIMAKMLWNPTQDVEALFEDYFKGFYGPAAEPMSAFWRLLEDAMSGQGYITGSIDEISRFFVPELIRAADGYLAQAQAKVAEAPPRFQWRLSLIADGWKYFKEFVEALRIIDKLRGKPAQQQLLVPAQEKFRNIFDFLGTDRGQIIFEAPLIRNQLKYLEKDLGGFDTAALPIGRSEWREDMNYGGWARARAVAINGYYPGWYGWCLRSGQEGEMIYKVSPEQKDAFFTSAVFRLWFYKREGVQNEVAISWDGVEFNPIAVDRNWNGETLDLTEKVRGKKQFFLRFRAKNGTPSELTILDQIFGDFQVGQ